MKEFKLKKVKKKKKLKLDGQEVECEFRQHQRAKRLKIIVYHDGRLAVTYPRWSSRRQAEKLLRKKSDWILKRLDKMKKKIKKDQKEKKQSLLSRGTRKNYLENKETAREIIEKKVVWFALFYDFSYNRIAIRNQRTRWGSCSSKRNLNFNYRIIYLPEKYIDYLVVHELCHLQEMNHSKKFWSLVEKVIPNYKKTSKSLRQM